MSGRIFSAGGAACRVGTTRKSDTRSERRATWRNSGVMDRLRRFSVPSVDRMRCGLSRRATQTVTGYVRLTSAEQGITIPSAPIRSVFSVGKMAETTRGPTHSGNAADADWHQRRCLTSRCWGPRDAAIGGIDTPLLYCGQPNSSERVNPWTAVAWSRNNRRTAAGVQTTCVSYAESACRQAMTFFANTDPPFFPRPPPQELFFERTSATAFHHTCPRIDLRCEERDAQRQPVDPCVRCAI